MHNSAKSQVVAIKLYVEHSKFLSLHFPENPTPPTHLVPVTVLCISGGTKCFNTHILMQCVNNTHVCIRLHS